MPEISGNFEGPIGSRVPEDVRDAERLLEAVRRLAALLDEVEAVLSAPRRRPRREPLPRRRRDVRASSTGSSSKRGPWYLDVGYHIGCTLSPEERRRNEQDLLVHYLDRLRAEGGDAPSWDEALRSIGSGLVYGFFLWAITLKVAAADHHRDARAAREPPSPITRPIESVPAP